MQPDRRPAKPESSDLQSTETVPLGWLLLRVLWIAVELIVGYWLAWQAQPFFYQRF
jgi:hypothetical protein